MTIYEQLTNIPMKCPKRTRNNAVQITISGEKERRREAKRKRKDGQHKSTPLNQSTHLSTPRLHHQNLSASLRQESPHLTAAFTSACIPAHELFIYQLNVPSGCPVPWLSGLIMGPAQSPLLTVYRPMQGEQLGEFFFAASRGAESVRV